MSEWRPIEEIPEALKDGREVQVKRVYNGGVVKEGLAVFAVPADGAPMTLPIGPTPLAGPLIMRSNTNWSRMQRSRSAG